MLPGPGSLGEIPLCLLEECLEELTVHLPSQPPSCLTTENYDKYASWKTSEITRQESPFFYNSWSIKWRSASSAPVAILVHVSWAVYATTDGKPIVSKHFCWLLTICLISCAA